MIPTLPAAGVMATPLIAKRSGLTQAPIGANLRFHPSCYILGVFDDAVVPWTGATQGAHCTEFLDRGINLEAVWAHPAVFATRLPHVGKQFGRYLKRYDKMAVWDGWVSGEDSLGSVATLPGGRADSGAALSRGIAGAPGRAGRRRPARPQERPWLLRLRAR